MIMLRAVVWAAVALLAAQLSFADPTFPPLSGIVVDSAGVIDAGAKAQLEAKLTDYAARSQHQLVVATVPSLEGYDVRDYGNRLFRAWALGDKQRNDGALLLVAPNERKVAIEVGYGLEGDLTDALSRIIIENAIVPRFKAGDYAGGVNAGVDDIIKAVGGGGNEIVERANNQSAPTFADVLPLVIFLIIVFFILMRSSRGRRVIFLPMPGGYSGGGWSSGGGGWSGGGGFSGGGGSSGGGGASGSW
jgi:uncharacterized protein